MSCVADLVDCIEGCCRWWSEGRCSWRPPERDRGPRGRKALHLGKETPRRERTLPHLCKDAT